MSASNDRSEAVDEACREAARAILARRATLPGLAHKDDGSPVTEADRVSSALLRERLRALDASIPVVCEEGEQHLDATTRFWLVDPLDGTREFVRGGPLFTINVALIEHGFPVFGLIHAPVEGRSWWGAPGTGAFRDGAAVHARCLPAAPVPIRVLHSPGESRERPGPVLGRVLARVQHAECTGLPGALKFCRLAEGSADLYPRSVPSCGWDTAAGQAIVEAAGGAVFGADGKRLRYEPLPGWRNGEFLAVADARHDWRALISPD